MDWEILFAPVSTGALQAVTDILPVAIPVLVALVGIGIAIRVFGKFGVKK